MTPSAAPKQVYPLASASLIFGFIPMAWSVFSAAIGQVTKDIMRPAILCVSSTLILSSCVVVNENKPEATTPQHMAEDPSIRGALSGKRQLLASFYAIGSDCTSLGYPTLKVAKSPQHGTVSVEQGAALADFDKSDQRNVCNGKSVPATVIYYTSVNGFTGDDKVDFERIGVRGAYGYHTYTIHVR